MQFCRVLQNAYDFLGNFQNVQADTVKSRYLEIDRTIFYKFKLPEVQINLHFG